MKDFIKFKKLFILFILLLVFMPFYVFAMNDVAIDDDVDLDIFTSNTGVPVTVTISSGGQATSIDMGGSFNYIDITLDNASDLIFTVPSGRYIKITKQSGSNDYTITPSCPTNTATLNGNGAQVILRLEVTTTNNCTTQTQASHSSSGSYIKYIVQKTDIVSDQIKYITTNKTCSLYMTKYVKQGLKNDPMNVKKLQQFLKDYEGFTTLKVDGKFGPISLNAVKKFQLKYKKDILGPWGMTKPSGWVYKTTLKKINELYCKYISQ